MSMTLNPTRAELSGRIRPRAATIRRVVGVGTSLVLLSGALLLAIDVGLAAPDISPVDPAALGVSTDPSTDGSSADGVADDPFDRSRGGFDRDGDGRGREDGR
ncbi:hypothetical protein [Microbacterium karelineae]|uniref:hypothetical protein n=1 Tax=Microbacterium karelineae TaxID=2654283 RepID=UPI0012EAA344|nr:hypothetical protein [Microbacterium karelineae]